MTVMIGVGPHKGSPTAVAIDGDEAKMATVKVRASRAQLRRDARTTSAGLASVLGLYVRG